MGFHSQTRRRTRNGPSVGLFLVVIAAVVAAGALVAPADRHRVAQRIQRAQAVPPVPYMAKHRR